MSVAVRISSIMAWRNLWRNYRRTLIMLLAIAVGAWAMIFLTAILRGMVDDMVKQGIRALPGHVQIHARDYRDDPSVNHGIAAPGEALLNVLNGGNVKAWTGRVKVPAMISSEYDNRGITLLGVGAAGEIALGFDTANVIEGRWLNGVDDEGVVIGRKLMQRLETGLGKRIVVMSQDPDNDIAERGFRIVGVYTAEMESIEDGMVYAGIGVVQEMLGIRTDISEIAVLGFDYQSPDALVSQLRSAAPATLEVLSWLELDPYLATMMKVMNGFVLVWMVVVFLALSFGLVNTLMMAVFERVREIGLMQALGMRPSAIVVQILLESLVLLLLGLLLGNLLAVATIVPLKGGIDISVVSQGMEMMGASSVLYPVLLWPDVLLANAVVIVLGVLTSSLPAWRAAQYRPVRALTKN